MQPKLVECTGCHHDRPVWKRVEGNPYCKYCAPKSAIKRTAPAPPAARKPIPKRTKKKIAEDALYSALRIIFFAKPENQYCQVRQCGCMKNATDVHHKRGKGIYYLVVETWLAVCRHCHNWIDKNSEEAMRLGFTESRLANETTEREEGSGTE